MLDALRRGAQSWLAKVLFAVLIISFGVFWNIEDVFRGAGRGSIAKVGEQDVSIPEFQQALQNELQNLSRQAGKRITTEEARAAGLDGLVLKRLVNDAALSEYAKELKLGISEDALVDNLKKDENLQGADGKFSRAILEEVMRNMGVNERGLLALLRKDELKRQLLTALSNATAVPQPLLDLQHGWNAEQRKIEFFHIDPSTAVKVPEPDDAALKSTYETHKRQFVVPEYRKIAALVLAVEDLKKEMTVTDEEIKQYYEAHKETYDVAEKRRIQQIPFKDRAAAEEAKKALTGGKSFRDVAKDAGATEADINLGLLTKKQLIDKTIAEAAFKLKRDEVSDVIEGRFRPVIVRVVEIQEGKESTLAEVTDKVKDTLAREKAGAEIQQRFEAVEENRNLGKSLKEIADTLKLKFIEVEASDRFNKRPDGGRALDHPDEQAIISAAFSSEKGLDRDAIELKQTNGYAWVDVVSVTEEKQKSLEESKADVKSVFEDMERKRLVDDLATQLVARADLGATFDKLAADGGGKPEVTEAITRTTTPPGLDEAAVQKAFALAKGKSGSADTPDRKSRIVFRVQDVIAAAAPTEAQRNELATELRAELFDDQLAAYIQALNAKLGVSINEAEFKRATGADQQQ
jgi:peptidyl-prolyl cis-trans isomerase D